MPGFEAQESGRSRSSGVVGVSVARGGPFFDLAKGSMCTSTPGRHKFMHERPAQERLVTESERAQVEEDACGARGASR